MFRILCLSEKYNEKFHIKVFAFSSLSQSGNIYNSSAVVHMSLRITRSITTSQCWQMIVQYTCPVTLNDTWKGVQVVNTKQSSESITNFFVSFLENN